MVIEVTFDVTDVYISTTVSPVYVSVSFEQPSSGGAAVWGSITGTLSDQTDLQTALDGKVPYTGATQDVSLGEYGINVGNVIYDTTPTGIPTDQGATYWDDQAETVALVMNGTIQKIGEDTFYHVKNSTGSTIAKGVAVRFAGTDGASGKILIAPFLADGTYPSQYYMGITAEEILNGADGKVYHFGKIRGVNTSAFADGDILYCSTSVAGGFQTTAPSAPNNIVIAAAVINAGNNGTLMVRTTTGSNINTDEGVLLTTPTSGQVLKYNGSLWVNDSVSGALGYTPANAATTLTINGVTYDLSANRSWTVSGGISGSGASGQVAYWTGATTQAGSNNLFWDAANGRLGIGTSTPLQNLHIVGNQLLTGTTPAIVLAPSGWGTQAVILYTGVAINNTAVGSYGVFAVDGASRGFAWRQGATVNMAIFAGSGNVGIGASSDGGQRLQVNGTTLLNGNVTFSSATGMFWDATNSRLGIGTNVPTKLLSVNGEAEATILRGSTVYFRGGVDTSFYAKWETGDFLTYRSFGIHRWQTFSTSYDTRMQLFANGNLLLQNGGTFTDSGQRLQVNGTTLLNGNVTFSSATGMTWDATNSRLGIGTNAPQRPLHIYSNSGMWVQSPTGGNAVLILTPTGFDTLNNSIIDFSINATSKAKLYSTGNLILQNGGTFTDSGERLQVTGTMKVTDNITLSANSTSFKGFTAINSSSASVATLEVKNNLSTTGYFRAYGSTFGTSTYSELADIVGFGSTKSIKIFADANVTSGGTNSIQFMAGGFNDDQERVRIGTYGMLIGTKTSTASSILTLSSTTKGFLPPRMTTTQKNAISSPAAGLVVYDTTLAKLCVYTTAWETITSI